MTALLISRQEQVRIIGQRDGYLCAFPGCGKVLDKANPPTIDHWMPKAWCRENGWTDAQIEALLNKKLMCKPCNAKKGHTLPNPDGTLPVKAGPARIAKVARPEICDTCYSGRILNIGEICPDCGIGPQPARWPTSLQKRPKECNHSEFHCWMCVVDDPSLRASATMRLIAGPPNLRQAFGPAT